MQPALVYEHGAVELIGDTRIASITIQTIQDAGLDDIDPKHYGVRLYPARCGATVSEAQHLPSMLIARCGGCPKHWPYH
jgi:hypothetical protein